MQVAAGRALHYAEQLRRKGRRVTISLPSATTARDIQPTRPGETRPRTSHRDIALPCLTSQGRASLSAPRESP